jgi:hypothetical protein
MISQFRTRKRLLGAVAAFLTLVHGHAYALRTGNEFLKYCESADLAYCYGYLDGALDAARRAFLDNLTSPETLASLSVGKPEPTPSYCIPPKVTLAQLRLIFLNYARDNPKNLHVSALMTFFPAVAQAFPCNAR